MLLGWLVTSLSMMILILFSDLNMQSFTQTDETGLETITTIPSENAPSVAFLSVSFLLFGTGYWFADVMGDSLVVS